MTATPARTQRPANALPWWLSTLLVLGALGVLSLAYGALISPKTLLGAGQQMNDAAHVWARYAAAYALALGLALLALITARARLLLAGALMQAAVAEVLLGVVGITDHRWEQVPADAVLAAVFLLGASRLFGQPPWRPAAWRDHGQSGP
jgi:hypothetical protein